MMRSTPSRESRRRGGEGYQEQVVVLGERDQQKITTTMMWEPLMGA